MLALDLVDPYQTFTNFGHSYSTILLAGQQQQPLGHGRDGGQPEEPSDAAATETHQERRLVPCPAWHQSRAIAVGSGVPRRRTASTHKEQKRSGHIQGSGAQLGVEGIATGTGFGEQQRPAGQSGGLLWITLILI